MALPYKHRPTTSHLMHVGTLRTHKGNMLVSSPPAPATPPIASHPRTQSLSEGPEAPVEPVSDAGPRTGSLDIAAEKVMVSADHSYQKKRRISKSKSTSVSSSVASTIWKSLKKFKGKQSTPDAESIADSTISSSFSLNVPPSVAMKRSTTYAGPIPVIMISSEEHWNSFDDEVFEVAEVLVAQKTQRNLAKWRSTDL